MKDRIQRRIRRQGSATVEFAITFPLMLAFFGFFWEFARAEMIRQTTATAAYEGARQAIVEGGSAADARQSAQALLDAVAIRGALITVTPDVITSDTSAVQVSISVPLSSNAWVTPFFIRNLNINASMTLTKG